MHVSINIKECIYCNHYFVLYMSQRVLDLLSFKGKMYQDVVDPESTNPFQLSIEQYFNPRENPGKGLLLDYL